MTTSLDSVAMSPSAASRSVVAQCAPSLTVITSRAAIDLTVVVHSGWRLTQVTGVLWMAMVKVDVHGHGLGPIVLAALSVETSWPGVAQPAEILTLRVLLDEVGVSRPVGEPTSQAPRLLTWFLSVMELDRAAIEDSPPRTTLVVDLDLSVSTLPQLRALSATARAQERAACPYLKVDTGMLCSGATVEELPTLAAALGWTEDEETVDAAGPWSHLSCTDEPVSDFAEKHPERYQQVKQVVLAAGLNPPTHHLAATGGLLWHPQVRMDLVRVGIGMYELSPDPSVATGAELGLRPAMRLEFSLVQVKRIEAGQTVSYKGTRSAPTDRWAGLMPLGYSGSIPRAASSVGPVEVDSLMTFVVGQVYMNRMVIGLGPATNETGAPPPAAARVGGTAVLWGAPAVSGQEAVPAADEWTRACGIINCEIVTRLGAHVPRRYVGESGTGDYSRPQTASVGYRRSPPD